jgi:zinc protease
MILLRRFLLAFFLVLALPAQAAEQPWLYRGSDVTPDPAWRFGTLPNGLRYAIRKNGAPAGQVSIRLRMAVGALNETDREQGYAHFIEHMVFRGTKSFPDNEARHVWESLGASFGIDTNAATTHTQTVFQLDLPHADSKSIDLSLHVLAEMADSALIDPATVEAERKVVLAEKGRQPELQTKLSEASQKLFFAGTKASVRDVIGTDATLGGATAPALRAFYERWYRPERATLVIVGDADPALLERLVAERFAAWRGAGPAPREPDYGRPAATGPRASTIVYAGAPATASAAWLRPFVPRVETVASDREDLVRLFATRIVNRRLEARARADAAFVGARLGSERVTNTADATLLTLSAKEGRWAEALQQVFAVVNDARAAAPSPAEIARELSNFRTALAAAVEGDAGVPSQQRANQLVREVEQGEVPTTPATNLALFDALAPQMTPALVEQAIRSLFVGAGPKLLLLAPTLPTGGEPAVLAALAAAEHAAPAARGSERSVGLADLPKLGPPGKEASRQQIADLGVTIVRFANGSSLVFKHTNFHPGQVSAELRFGNGLSGFAPNRPSAAWLAGLVAPSGLGSLDQDALERLITGRRMGMQFGMAEDAWELSGVTSAADLENELHLLAAKLAYPRWDEPLFARYKTSMLQANGLIDSSPTARGQHELTRFVHGGDERWANPERPEIEAATVAQFRQVYEPVLASGPIEAVIVGDVTLDQAVAAMLGTVAALPPRPQAPLPAGSLSVHGPAPAAAPLTFSHKGDPNQALAVIGWTTGGSAVPVRERRALSVAARILRERLFEQLRQAEGASYSPTGSASGSDTFPDWGVFLAIAELKPESAPTFFRIGRQIVAELAARPVAAEEFTRAINPVLSAIERARTTNAYWVGTMEGWSRRPELIEQTRSYVHDYESMTREEVQAAMAKLVAARGDWSMLVLPANKGGGAK